MRSELRKQRQAKEWLYFSARALEMKILDSDIDLKLTQKDWQGMLDDLKEYRREENWPYFSSQAMAVRILDPKMDLRLDQQAWNGMRDDLERCRHDKNYIDFSELTLAMKILVAEKVEVTDNGLEISMRKDKPLVSEVPPVPETKQF